jgi:hypothetical protein
VVSDRQPLLKAAIAAAGLAAAVVMGLAATNAAAVPAAGMDQVIRPAFGELLRPPLHHWRPDRPDWRYDHAYGWRGGYGQRFRRDWADPDWRRQQGYAPQGPIDTITVDCSDPALGPTPLADALDALSDGGTLYIRRGPRPCGETLLITRPVTIAGEPLSAFASPGPADSGPLIAPAPGAPCLRVGPGAGVVEIRDLTFRADQAGHAACIESWDSDLALTRTRLIYTGEASALFLSGGRLILRGSDIQAVSYDSALTLEDAAVEFSHVRISAATDGVDLAARAGAPLIFDHVYIRGIAGSDAASQPETGLMLRRSLGEPAHVDIRNSRITGFKTDLWFQRSGQVEVHQTMIAGARVGVLSEDADLTIADSALEARRTGIYVDGGHAEISHNRIYGFTGAPVDAEPGADLNVHDNWIYPADDCHRYYDRFSRWCRRFEEVPEVFRDHPEDPSWGWEGGPFDPPPPPPPPPERHGFFLWFGWGGHDHDRDHDHDHDHYDDDRYHH